MHAPPTHFPDARYQQGRDYLSKGYYDEALAAFEQLVQHTPHDPRLHYQLGQTHHQLGDAKAALAAYRMALKAAPNHADILNAMANTYQMQGDIEKSIRYYEKAFATNPTNAPASFNLVQMKSYDADHPVIRILHQLYANTTNIRDKTMMCFALGEYYEKQKKLPEAFPYYEEGNRLAYAQFPTYDPAKELAMMQEIIHVFSPDLLEQCKEMGNPNATPIFIIGMPRSGTTLVEQILASHPQVAGAGEINALTMAAFHTSAEFGKASFPQSISHLTPDHMTQLASHYMAQLKKAARSDKPFLCDKTPTNFLFVGLIRLMFPKACIIHCVRDAMDTCWSCYKHLFIDRHPYCYHQTTLGNFYRQYENMMQHWHALLPGAVHDVVYEELVENPETAIRAMLDHCGLAFDRACLNFHRTNRSVATASALQVRRPLYKTSMKSWESIAEKLQPLQDALAG